MGFGEFEDPVFPLNATWIFFGDHFLIFVEEYESPDSVVGEGMPNILLQQLLDPLISPSKVYIFLIVLFSQLEIFFVKFIKGPEIELPLHRIRL